MFVDLCNTTSVAYCISLVIQCLVTVLNAGIICVDVCGVGVFSLSVSTKLIFVRESKI